jgi:azurin
MRLLTILLFTALFSQAQTVDQTIALGVRHGELRFDKELLVVKPKTTVKILFTNNDEMPHNVVICKPGTDTKAIGEAALAMGVDGLAKHYIPDSKQILVATPLVEPAATHEFLFKVPGKDAEYPFVCTFPGHYLLMVGAIRVGDNGRIANLAYSLYEGSWDKLPDFSKLEPKKEGTLPSGLLSIKPGGKDNFGLLFTGRLNVPKAGTYTFNMASDDGMRVQIDGKTVVEHDGIHGMEAKQGKAKLEAGVREIRVAYFEKVGGEGLALKWSGPGFKSRPLSESKAPNAGGGGGDFIVKVAGAPYIYRTGLSVPGIAKGAYSIAVGMPGGVSYCFDAERCFLRAAWSGDFINAEADWNRRGGSGAKSLGEVFYKNDAQFPIGIAGVDAVPDFRGYELKDGYPVFEYRLGEAEVRASVRPNASNSGLIQHFEVSGAEGQVAYAAPGHEKTYGPSPTVSFDVEVVK